MEHKLDTTTSHSVPATTNQQSLGDGNWRGTETQMTDATSRLPSLIGQQKYGHPSASEVLCTMLVLHAVGVLVTTPSCIPLGLTGELCPSLQQTQI